MVDVSNLWTGVEFREDARVTDAMVSIEGENMREVTWVVVEEVKSGSWGMGGKALTTGDIKAMVDG
jgi:4-oxalocrotonate tautomerase